MVTQRTRLAAHVPWVGKFVLPPFLPPGFEQKQDECEFLINVLYRRIEWEQQENWGRVW